MIMRRYLLILVLLSLAVCTAAQNISNKERRNINFKALNLIEEYERTASLSDSEEIYSFLNLFQSPESKVYCDLMGTKPYMQSINLKDYVKTASASVLDLDIIIKDVRKGELSKTAGVWTLPITFKKTISYVDNNGVLFSTEEFYENNDFEITLNLVYDPADKSCRIGSIDGRLRSQKDFPESDFFVVGRNDALSDRGLAYQERLKINGQPLEYNSFDQAIVPTISPISVGDPDIIIDTNVLVSAENYKLVNFKFKPIRSRFKVRAAVAPIMAYKVKTEYNSRSFAFETGLDFGTTFVAGSAKLGIYIGAALSMSNVTLSRFPREIVYGNVSYFDKELGCYNSDKLTYLDFSDKSSLKLKDIAIPLYFEAEHRINNTLLFTWNLGAKAYLPLSTGIGNYEVTAKRQIGNHNGLKEDLPDMNAQDGFLNPVSVEREPFSVSVAANLGLDINLVKNRLFATVKAGYEQGLTKVLSATKCQAGDGLDDSPMFYHPDGEVICHSPLSGMSLRRQAVWFELGIKVKL